MLAQKPGEVIFSNGQLVQIYRNNHTLKTERKLLPNGQHHTTLLLNNWTHTHLKHWMGPSSRILQHKTFQALHTERRHQVGWRTKGYQDRSKGRDRKLAGLKNQNTPCHWAKTCTPVNDKPGTGQSGQQGHCYEKRGAHGVSACAYSIWGHFDHLSKSYQYLIIQAICSCLVAAGR